MTATKAPGLKRLRQLERLEAACLAWRRKYKPSGAESMYQRDACNIGAPELAIAVFKILGWEPFEDD